MDRTQIDTDAMATPLMPNAWIARAAVECAAAIVEHKDPHRARAKAIDAFTAAIDLAVRDAREMGIVDDARREGL